ncbi:MAG: tetratricopeptide repeat protein [Planctomycetota bacterium]
MEPWVQAYMAGMKRFGADDYPGAAVHYRESLELRPDNTEVLHALAAALMYAGDLDEAIATADRIVELDPTDHLVHTSLSMMYQRKGMIDEAEAQAAKARLKAWKAELKQNPNAPPPDDGPMNVIQ